MKFDEAKREATALFKHVKHFFFYNEMNNVCEDENNNHNGFSKVFPFHQQHQVVCRVKMMMMMYKMNSAIKSFTCHFS